MNFIISSKFSDRRCGTEAVTATCFLQVVTLAIVFSWSADALLRKHVRSIRHAHETGLACVHNVIASVEKFFGSRLAVWSWDACVTFKSHVLSVLEL